MKSIFWMMVGPIQRQTPIESKPRLWQYLYKTILDYRLTLLAELWLLSQLVRCKVGGSSVALPLKLPPPPKKKKNKKQNVPLPKHFKLFPELVQSTECGVVLDTMGIIQVMEMSTTVKKATFRKKVKLLAKRILPLKKRQKRLST